MTEHQTFTTAASRFERALLIGASGGIGAAVHHSLRTAGCKVTTLSRSTDGFDITDAPQVDAVLGALDGPFDLILIASGALEIDGAEPEKSLRHLDARAMMDQFAVNAMGPAMVLRHVPRLTSRRAPACVAVLTARVGSIGDNRLGGWYSYRAAKAAANQVVRTASIELARTHKQLACVALHPGTVATEFTRKYVGRHPAVPPQDAAGHILRVLGGLHPEQTGRFFDWAGAEVPW